MASTAQGPDTRRLQDGFLRAAAETPDAPALEVDGATLSYAALAERAKRVAATLVTRRRGDGSPLTCVLGQRSEPGFIGILGALCSGHGYVPMLPSYPASRIALMIARSRSREVVVDTAGARLLAEVLADPALGGELPALTIVAPGLDDGDAGLTQLLRAAAGGGHAVLGRAALASADGWRRSTAEPDDIAYLLFTSGSTGQPKGVMVAHRNIVRFTDVVTERYDLTPQDRFSHLFDVTFDLSLFDLFGAWSVGACLCCPDARQRMLPARYVADSRLSVWFSVPSTALLMKNTRTLTEGSMPGLRLGLFCGEALTVPVAAAFAKAAPNAVVENLYGPTELTLACTLHRFEGAGEDADAGEVVPIGEPFPGMRARVVDPETMADVGEGEGGELIVAGPQVALGYWDAPDITARAFVTPPGEDEVFYRTGDRVRRAPGGPLEFLGRMDTQVKIRGYRVELGEIEAAIRREGPVLTAVALDWPRAASGGAEGVVAFIDDRAVDTGALQQKLLGCLPRYMLPRRIHVIDAFPLNPNGKIDRKALRATLDNDAPAAKT